jgi:hypothetical protein
LAQDLEEEQGKRSTLKESLVGLEESNNLNISCLTKERDHALAMVKILKKEKIEFDIGHAHLLEDLEKLDKANKALESKCSSLMKK